MAAAVAFALISGQQAPAASAAAVEGVGPRAVGEPQMTTAEWLAPGPGELGRGLARGIDAASRADAIEASVARIHNRIGEYLAAGHDLAGCADPVALSWAARAAVFAVHHRDAVQSARAQLDRVERLVIAPTLTPLVDDSLRASVDGLRATVERQRRNQREISAWHARHVLPILRACRPSLVEADGVSTTVSTAANDTSRGVAVTALRPGRPCPGGAPGEVIVVDRLACYGEVGCMCIPRPVLPGAVLGP